MGFKELNDVDGNGLKDVAQLKPENKFDLSDSDEVADKLKREDLQSAEESPDKKRLLDKADPAGLEEIPKSLESDLLQDDHIKEKAQPDESALPQNQESATRRTAESIPASLELPDEFKKAPGEPEAKGNDGVSLTEGPDHMRSRSGEHASIAPSEQQLSSETKETLGHFEQTNWNKLSSDEKKEAMSSLCDGISKDLGIKETPDVRFYSGDSNNFGGYSRQDNAIYVNENTISNGREAADTIAHETRHCWQHERAEKPVTEQDYALKNNLENYTNPQTNYEVYKGQLVEQDAHQYAVHVRESLPSTPSEPVIQIPHAEPGSQGASFAELNPNRGAVFDERALPEDINAKLNYEAVGSTVHNGKDFNETLREQVYSDRRFSAEGITRETMGLYQHSAERIDINACNNPKALIISDREDGTREVSIAFHGYHGLDENKPIRGFFNADGSSNLPDVFYRQGSEYGNNLTTNMPDGSIPTNDQVAVPYVDNPAAKHTYLIDIEGYKQAVDIIKDVDLARPDDISSRTERLNSLKDSMNAIYGLECVDVTEDDMRSFKAEYDKFQNCSATHDCRNTQWAPDTTYGLCGTVAPMHVNDEISREKLYEGGAPQFNTAGRVGIYTMLGVIRENYETNRI